MGRPRNKLYDFLREEYRITAKTICTLGGAPHLMALDELPRRVLINSLKWKKTIPGRAVRRSCGEVR